MHTHNMEERKPVTSDVSTFITIVKSAGGWVSAAELKSITGFSPRKSRACREHAGGEVISGNNGYCHIDNASNAEINGFIERMNSHARRVTVGALEVRKHPSVLKRIP